MEKTLEQLIEKYLKDNPELVDKWGKKEIRQVCNYPFKWMRRIFVSGSLEQLRLKNLGVFKVTEPSVKTYLSYMQKALDRGKIDKKKYDMNVKNYIDYEGKINK